MFWSCLQSGNNVRGCAVLWSPDLCPPLLQQTRPTRTSLLDRSTISCPGNKAVSSSDSKCTRANPSVTVFNPENQIAAPKWTKSRYQAPTVAFLYSRTVTCVRLDSFYKKALLLCQKCCGPDKTVGKSSLTWAAAVITCSVFCFLWFTQQARGSLVIMSSCSTVCVNTPGSGLYPRHHQAASHVICPNMPADEAANLCPTLCQGTDQ